jgi:hypothetical protein
MYFLPDGDEDFLVVEWKFASIKQDWRYQWVRQLTNSSDFTTGSGSFLLAMIVREGRSESHEKSGKPRIPGPFRARRAV